MLGINESRESRSTVAPFLILSVQPAAFRWPIWYTVVLSYRFFSPSSHLFFSLHHYLVPRDLIIHHAFLIPLPVFICPIQVPLSCWMVAVICLMTNLADTPLFSLVIDAESPVA